MVGRLSRGDREVDVLAAAMQEKLDRNRHKAHWSEASFGTLFRRLREEVDKLEEAVMLDRSPRMVLLEAADVANFAMFIADNFGSIADGRGNVEPDGSPVCPVGREVGNHASTEPGCTCRGDS